MKKVISIFILGIFCLAAFKSATPFLSYKMNYEFILKERCEFRGTSQHDECDGFCYLRKKIEHQHGGDHEQPHSDKAISSHQFSSIFAILESSKQITHPFLKKGRYNNSEYFNKYVVYQDVQSPPPKA